MINWVYLIRFLGMFNNIHNACDFYEMAQRTSILLSMSLITEDKDILRASEKAGLTASPIDQILRYRESEPSPTPPHPLPRLGQ